jgi:hypothetical protein
MTGRSEPRNGASEEAKTRLTSHVARPGVKGNYLAQPLGDLPGGSHKGFKDKSGGAFWGYLSKDLEFYGLLAQLVEHPAFNQMVVRSNPTQPTSFKMLR